MPFRSYRAATRWLERQSRSPRKPPRQVAALLTSAHEAIRAASRLTTSRYTLHIEAEALGYMKPGASGQPTLPVPPGSSLAPLAKGVRLMVAETGLTEPQLVAHVLAGVPLRVSPVHLRLDEAGLVLTLRRCPTVSEWQRLGKQVRREWRKKTGKVRRYTARDLKLLRVIQRHGPLPARGKGRVEYWTAIAQKCDPPTTWRAAYNWWTRLGPIPTRAAQSR